jgi:hypothetical protein
MMASRQRSHVAYSRQSGAAGLGGCGGEGLLIAGKGGRQAATGQTIVLIICLVTAGCYFAAFTALCWFLNLAFPGKLATQSRLRFFFDAGVVGGLLALVCSFILWRSCRGLAVIGFAACLLWAIWSALPRL